MNAPVRWAVVVVDILLIVALVIWARGDAHHRGDDIGSLPQIVHGDGQGTTHGWTRSEGDADG